MKQKSMMRMISQGIVLNLLFSLSCSALTTTDIADQIQRQFPSLALEDMKETLRLVSNYEIGREEVRRLDLRSRQRRGLIKKLKNLKERCRDAAGKVHDKSEYRAAVLAHDLVKFEYLCGDQIGKDVDASCSHCDKKCERALVLPCKHVYCSFCFLRNYNEVKVLKRAYKQKSRYGSVLKSGLRSIDKEKKCFHCNKAIGTVADRLLNLYKKNDFLMKHLKEATVLYDEN